MAQTGVVYVAVAAAAISAGALGFSVIWSYEPAEPPTAVSPAQPPQIAAPAAKDTRAVPPVASAVPSAAGTATGHGKTRGASPSSPRRYRARTRDGPTPRRRGNPRNRAIRHRRDRPRPRTPKPPCSSQSGAGRRRRASTERPRHQPRPRRPGHRRPLRRRPRRSRLRQCVTLRWTAPVKPGDVAPPVQSRHANAASPKADTVVADVPQVIRMPSAPTQIPARVAHAPEPHVLDADRGWIPVLGKDHAQNGPVRARPRQHAAVAS